MKNVPNFPNGRKELSANNQNIVNNRQNRLIYTGLIARMSIYPSDYLNEVFEPFLSN